MKTIAFVGNFQPAWSTENDVRLALESLGHQVVPLQENRVNYRALRQHALRSDLLLWTSTWDQAFPLEESIDTLQQCRVAGIPTATYHLDVFHGTNRGGRRWWLNPMFFTEHVYTADGDHQDEFAARGINHSWLRPGVRHTVTQGRLRADFACDVAFVGSDARNTNYHDEWPYRRELVDKLEEICVRRGWSFRNPGGRQPKIDRGDMADFYASAKVTVGDSLCPLREKSRYWSDRVYEATGRGGLLIMPQLDELRDDFDGWLPMYPWGDWDELEKMIDLYLKEEITNQLTRSKCQNHARNHHTYVNRVQEILANV